MKYFRPRFLSITFTVFSVLLGNVAGSAQTTARKPYKQKKPAKAAPDVLIFTNGDRLQGKFLHAVGGKLLFHSNMLGNIHMPWSKVKELHTASQLAVLPGSVVVHRGEIRGNFPVGTLSLANNTLTVHPEMPAPLINIPVKRARYVLDLNTLRKQLRDVPTSFKDGTAL